MDVAYVSALAALVGSVVGGLTAGGTTWLSQRAHARAGQMAHEAALREDLYRDFITAASRAYSDAILNSEPQIPKLVSLYAMISRMRIVSWPRTIECADKIMLTIIEPISRQIAPCSSCVSWSGSGRVLIRSGTSARWLAKKCACSGASRTDGVQFSSDEGRLIEERCRPCACCGRRLLPLGSQLPEETSEVGPDPLLNEPALIVKPENVHQVPDYMLAVRS
jgi:hypothetical protein